MLISWDNSSIDYIFCALYANVQICLVIKGPVNFPVIVLNIYTETESIFNFHLLSYTTHMVLKVDDILQSKNLTGTKLLLPPKKKLGKGYVFTRVCDLFTGGVSRPTPMGEGGSRPTPGEGGV